MYKPALMIHQIDQHLFQLPLERFLLTFDDGTEDHWHFFSDFLAIATRKIYFITCSWVGRPGFVTVDQLRTMMTHPDVEIGAHSFDHADLNNSTLQEKILHLEQDTQRTCDWFQTNLGFQPKTFAYPNNHAQYGVYTKILQQWGFNEFYGNERIDPEWLGDPEWTRWHTLW
jgi:peptidoglycan/xylan/chitin deacetylase (PgdA/CDA1 family)